MTSERAFMVLAGMGTKRLYTHSASAAWRACGYQYFLAYVLGVRARRAAKALRIGILVHLMLEAYWRARRPMGMAMPIGDGPLEAALVRLDAELHRLDRLGEGFDAFERARLRVMMVAYAAVWNTTRCEVLGVEEKFVTPLLHPVTREVSSRFERAGKIDLILRLADGRIALGEHKSSASEVGPGSDYRRRLTLDEQVSFYYAGAISLGFRPNLVVYDILKKFDERPFEATPADKLKYTKERWSKAKYTREKWSHRAGHPDRVLLEPPRLLEEARLIEPRRLREGQRLVAETPAEYERRLAEAVAKAPLEHIERVGVHRLPHERKAFALEVWNQAQLMAYALDHELFPRNSDACMRYGSPCAYLPHCSEGARLDDAQLFRRLTELHPELADEDDGQAAPRAAERTGT